MREGGGDRTTSDLQTSRGRPVWRPLATELRGDSSQTLRQTELTSSDGNPQWGARIRASIARLMEIDGICFDPYGKASEKRKPLSLQQYLPESVSQASAPSSSCDVVQGEYWDAMRDMYASSGGKRMKMTTKSSWLPSHGEGKAQTSSTDDWGGRTRSIHAKKIKAVKEGGMCKDSSPFDGDAGSEEHPAATRDPALFKAVERLSENLTRLLAELQSTSDAAAAEPILAAAAAITLEVTKMRRCEERAMLRMLEIEEHRVQITQGLLEYAQRKAMRERSERSE